MVHILPLSTSIDIILAWESRLKEGGGVSFGSYLCRGGGRQERVRRVPPVGGEGGRAVAADGEAGGVVQGAEGEREEDAAIKRVEEAAACMKLMAA